MVSSIKGWGPALPLWYNISVDYCASALAGAFLF